MGTVVSVIIPTYKGEKYLGRAIQTVLEQSFEDFEIIIVDDNGRGSYHQKETEKVVDNFADERIKYCIHENNRNGSAARNTGLREAKGKYICFLDDDDLLLKNRLRNAVSYLEINPEYNAVFSSVACADENLNITKIVKVNKCGDCKREILLNDMFFGTGSNIFMTRIAIETTGYFDERFVRHQDIEYMIRFYRNFKSGVINDIDIVKSKNGINNIPEYKKMQTNEELYNQVFAKEIEDLKSEKEAFFQKQEKVLLLSKLSSSKLSVAVIKEISKLPFRLKVIVLVNRLKLQDSKFFKLLLRNYKKRKYNKLKPSLPSELINFIQSRDDKWKYAVK